MTGPRSGPVDERPLLGMVATPGTAAQVRPLVRALSPFVQVRALGRCASRPAAVLATSAAALERVPPGIPAAVWLDRSTFPPLPGGVVAVGPEARATGGVVVGQGALDVSPLAPLDPAVRARWRRRFGLPVDWIVRSDAIADADRTTALALCSAAVVAVVAGGEVADLVVALALGTPVVTSAEGADAVGAADGVHLVVSVPGERATQVAEDVAADPYRCVRLGFAARTLVEAGGLDLGAAARRLVARLGITTAAAPLGGLGARLDDLATPPTSDIRRRAREATAVLTGAAT